MSLRNQQLGFEWENICFLYIRGWTNEICSKVETLYIFILGVDVGISS